MRIYPLLETASLLATVFAVPAVVWAAVSAATVPTAGTGGAAALRTY
jgi:hypothetical protein